MLKTIKWADAEQRIIKFTDTENVYDLSDNVTKYMQENKIGEKNQNVEVEIDSAKGDCGTLTKISLSSLVENKQKVESPPASQEKTEEKAVETEYKPPNADEYQNVQTVNGISKKNKGIIFKEKEDRWYTLTAEALLQIEENGIVKGNTVSFYAKKQEKGNDIIIKITKIDPPKQPEKTKNDYDKSNLKSNGKYTNEVQRSIEAQASVNSASDMTGRMFADRGINAIEVEKLVIPIRKQLAVDAFKLIQDLKLSSDVNEQS